jgi:hypothetical protein
MVVYPDRAGSGGDLPAFNAGRPAAKSLGRAYFFE